MAPASRPGTADVEVYYEEVEDYIDRRARYYDQAAPDYDNAVLGIGPYADRVRPASLDEDLETLGGTISRLPPGRILDVACGTGLLTRHLRGEVIGLDRSEEMLKIARKRVPEATSIRGDAFNLPFPNSSFERVFTSNFYGLLLPEERTRFLGETRRVAPEVILVEMTGPLDGAKPEGWQRRMLSDGSRHKIYRRYFTATGLAEELGGGRVLFAGGLFVMVAT
jgi:ubiquinone/menaquinone biosynthesis C-methylase UbiE